MIHGYLLNFKDEALLKKEYEALFLEYPLPSKYDTIDIEEAKESDYRETFDHVTDWRKLSGQDARYWSHVPFEKVGKTDTWVLEVTGVLSLVWHADKQKITYIKEEGYSPQRLRFWIYHTFFPIVLELRRECTMIHVGAVEVKDKLIFFSAPSYGGKSTLTDYFIQKGHVLFADDSLPVRKRGETYYATPSFPYHRPYRKTEELGYLVKNFATKAKPIHAIYRMEPTTEDGDINIEPLSGIDKYEALHFSHFIHFPFTKQERFVFFSKMAKHVPVYRITIPWDLERLDEVYHAIVTHVKEKNN